MGVEDPKMLEAFLPDGKTLKVYLSGKSEGFPEGTLLIHWGALEVSKMAAQLAEIEERAE